MSATLLHREIKPGTKLERSFVVNRAGINEEARTVELAFSSEAEYERWWGIEILDHSARAVDLSRLKRSGPILMDHDTTDHVGVIESVRIDADDRVGRCVARFGKGARASEVFQDVLDGIRTNVSVGYIIHEAKMIGEKDGVGTYRVTRWEPYEVSLVAVPADPSVGVGRALEDGRTQSPPEFIVEETRTMSDPVVTPAAPAAVDEAALRARIEKEMRAENRTRVENIVAMARQFRAQFPGVQRICEDAVESGEPFEMARGKVLEEISKNPPPKMEIGMTDKEVRRFSMFRALNAMVTKTPEARNAAAFEYECSRAYAEKVGKDPQGVFVPYDVLSRDLVVGTPTAGGNLVATDLLSGSFIELLRQRMVLMGMGVQMLSGLQGNVAIPRQTGGATAYWVAESGAPTESQQAFDQVTMSPKTLGAFTDISRKLLLQSSISVENFVRDDLTKTIALELQRVGINGSGSGNEPRGVLNTAGIGSVAGGTNGLAPNLDHIVGLETAIANANADEGAMAYLTNTRVRGKAKRTFIDSPGSGQRLWDVGSATPMNGYRAAVTNAVPSNLTKGSSSGVCSAILFGNWNELIYGLWGGLDLGVDNVTQMTSGTVRVVVLQDVDLAVRHVESFAAMLDALTV